MRLFSNSFMNDYKILNDVRVGIEFEFFSDLTYENTVETLSRRLGRSIKGIKQYHPDFKPTSEVWTLTPDWSALNMCELITHPMDYTEAVIMIPKVLSIINEIGYTNERSGIHINISFKSFDIQKMNIIKLFIVIDEAMIYSYFPDREDNIYCKSVKKQIPFKNVNYSSSSVSILNSMLDYSDANKYYGVNYINIPNGRVEYRYLGGEDYHTLENEILYLMDYFIVTTHNCITEPMTESDHIELQVYLDEKISEYNSLSSYFNFRLKYPKIVLQVDKEASDIKVSSYYSKIYDTLFDILKAIEIEEGIINYDIETNNIEIVNADINVIGKIKNTLFINCNIDGGDYTSCEIIKSNLINGIINSSNIEDSIIRDSKVIGSKVYDDSFLYDCYFAEGLLDANMVGGVYKSGKQGANTKISAETQIYDIYRKNFFSYTERDIETKTKK